MIRQYRCSFDADQRESEIDLRESNIGRDGVVTPARERSAMAKLLERELTRQIIGAFFDVYNELGYGFLENVYTLALERELVARGLKVGREVSIPIYYKGQFLTNHRADLIVEEKVLVENKSPEVLPPTTRPTVLNYLTATRIKVGLILHFGPEAKFYRLVSSKK